MNEKLYIPKKLNVGFQLRTDCYTGRLGYVIYWDDAGKLRKETSWENWRHKPEEGPSYYDHELKKRIQSESYGERVAPIEIENVPMEGFVLNKDVGGVRSSWGWNDRLEKVRVYDPRDFEFEISIPNLLYILQECSSIKGKGLEGQFVYSWSGKELVLLPTSSSEYQECLNFTKLQAEKVSPKDLVPGNLYTNKDKEVMVYVGKDYFISSGACGPFKLTKTHIFSEQNGEKFTAAFKPAKDLGEFDNFAFILDVFKKTDQGCGIKEVVLGESVSWGLDDRSYWRTRYEPTHRYGALENDGVFSIYAMCYDSQREAEYVGDFELKNGVLEKVSGPKRGEYYVIDASTVNFRQIKIVLDNGSEYPYCCNYSEADYKNHKLKTNL